MTYGNGEYFSRHMPNLEMYYYLSGLKNDTRTIVLKFQNSMYLKIKQVKHSKQGAVL